jgi:hypothetical protein
MSGPLKKLIFCCSLALGIAANSCYAQNVLMVITGASLNTEETNRRTQLQNWGFTVTTVQDSAAQGTIDTAVAAADVVYVPCTIDDWELLYKLRTADKGVVTETPGLDTEFGYNTADGYTQSYNSLESVVNTHQVTSGVASGTIVITSSNQNLALNGNTRAAGMTLLGTMNWGQMALGAIETGGTLANTYNGNSTASGRRVRLPWGWSLTFSSLNSNGLLILRNALTWAGGNKLLLHYKLDATSGTSVTDSSGLSRTGTVTGTATWVSAVRDNGFDFNGNTKIQYNGLLGNPANLTLAAWVNVDAIDSGGGSEVVSIGDYAFIRLTSTQAHMYLYNGSTWADSVATFAPVGAGWHHVAATFDDAANQVKIYIDGQLASTTTVNTSITYSGQGTATVVGRHGNNNTAYDMDGRVDDVRVYNYALTQAEVVVLYGLVGHWKMDETSGSSVADASGAGNSGTVTGTATWSAAIRGRGHRYNYNDGDDYITVSNSASLQDVQEDDYSLAMWFKANTLPPGTGFANDAVYGMLGKNALFYGAGYTHDQKFGMAHPFSDGSILQAYTTGTYGIGTFHHVVVTVKKSSGTMNIYVNGQLDSTHTFTANKTAYEQGTTPFRMGIAHPGSGSYKFAADGTMDDVRVYNRVISASEISLLYGNSGHWKLDETSGTVATDSSGANYHGTFTGSPTLNQTAVYDQGTLFNSATSTEYLILPREAVHGASTISVSFWIKTTQTGEQAVLSGNNAGQDNEFLLLFGSHTEFRIYCHGNTQSWTIPSIADNQWHHFAVISTADTNSTIVYKDGVSLGSRSVSANTTAFNIAIGGLIVAQEQDSVGGSFVAAQSVRGTLDDIRIYQRTLSVKELGELFGKVGHWLFSEGAGTTVADTSGAAPNANVNGATWTSDCSGNTAMLFDGINDTAATSTTFDPPNEGAVSFWFRSGGTPAARQRIWGNGADFEMWQDPDGYVSCDVSTDGFQSGCITTVKMDTLDKWYHMVCQWDADTEAYSIYIDGELHKSGTSSWGTVNQPAGIMTFGTRTGTSDYFKGAIRDFRVYNRPMFASEIAAAAGMIARWQLNETNGTVAADLSVAGNNATYVGSPTLGNAGSNTTNGNAVELNGTSQYVTSGKSLLNGLTDFTIAAWVRPDSITPDKSFLGQNGLIELGIDNSISQIDLWTSAGGSVAASKQLPLTKWSHVVAVGTGTNLKIYVNGVELISGGNNTASYGSNSGIFKIGEGVLAPSGDHFDGRLDDVRVYSRALCPGEIDDLYQAGRPAGIRIIRWVETR